MPIRFGNFGSGRLRSAANRPSAPSERRRSEASGEAARPHGRISEELHREGAWHNGCVPAVPKRRNLHMRRIARDAIFTLAASLLGALSMTACGPAS